LIGDKQGLCRFSYGNQTSLGLEPTNKSKSGSVSVLAPADF
jgi:hypothetical protein